MTAWRKHDLFVRGSVWRVPFQYETKERVRQPAGGRARQIPGTYVDHGIAKGKCWMIVLSRASDWSYVRVVCCSTLKDNRRAKDENDPTKVIFQGHVDEGGWTSPYTVADCANVRTIGNLAFAQGECDYKGRIDSTMMREVDRAVARGLGLGKY